MYKLIYIHLYYYCLQQCLSWSHVALVGKFIYQSMHRSSMGHCELQMTVEKITEWLECPPLAKLQQMKSGCIQNDASHHDPMVYIFFKSNIWRRERRATLCLADFQQVQGIQCTGLSKAKVQDRSRISCFLLRACVGVKWKVPEVWKSATVLCSKWLVSKTAWLIRSGMTATSQHRVRIFHDVLNDESRSWCNA